MIEAKNARQMTEESGVLDDILNHLNNLVHEKAHNGANRVVYVLKPGLEPSVRIELVNTLVKYGYEVESKPMGANGKTLITLIW